VFTCFYLALPAHQNVFDVPDFFVLFGSNQRTDFLTAPREEEEEKKKKDEKRATFI
jgi:hypothetical protein